MRIPDSELKLRTAYRKEHGSEIGFVPPPRKRRNNEESVMQRALIKWWQANCRHFEVPEILLFSIPNGGGGGKMRGHWLKLEGQRKGAPDLLLSVPAPGRRVFALTGLGAHTTKPAEWHALFLELKTSTGTVSPEQEVFHQRLTEQGYKVAVVRSLPEAINVITTYLT